MPIVILHRAKEHEGRANELRQSKSPKGVTCNHGLAISADYFDSQHPQLPQRIHVERESNVPLLSGPSDDNDCRYGHFVPPCLNQ